MRCVGLSSRFCSVVSIDESGPSDALDDDKINGDGNGAPGSNNGAPPTPPAGGNFGPNATPNDPNAPIGSGPGNGAAMTPPPRPMFDTPPVGPDISGPENVFVPDQEDLDAGNGDGEDTGPGSFSPADGNTGPGDVNPNEAQPEDDPGAIGR